MVLVLLVLQPGDDPLHGGIFHQDPLVGVQQVQRRDRADVVDPVGADQPVGIVAAEPRGRVAGRVGPPGGEVFVDIDVDDREVACLDAPLDPGHGLQGVDDFLAGVAAGVAEEQQRGARADAVEAARAAAEVREAEVRGHGADRRKRAHPALVFVARPGLGPREAGPGQPLDIREIEVLVADGRIGIIEIAGDDLLHLQEDARGRVRGLAPLHLLEEMPHPALRVRERKLLQEPHVGRDLHLHFVVGDAQHGGRVARAVAGKERIPVVVQEPVLALGGVDIDGRDLGIREGAELRGGRGLRSAAATRRQERGQQHQRYEDPSFHSKA